MTNNSPRSSNGSDDDNNCGSSGSGGSCCFFFPRHSEDRLWGAVEILPQRLYYAPLRFFPVEEEGIQEGGKETKTTKTSSKTKPIHYFSIDNEFIYWNFFLDFGPLNLGHLYRFCEKLNAKLSSPSYKDHILCYYSGIEGSRRANATYLICAYQILFLGRTLEEAYFGFEQPHHSQRGGWEEGDDSDDASENEEEVVVEGKGHSVMMKKKHRFRHWSNAAIAAMATNNENEDTANNNFFSNNNNYNFSLPPQQPQRHKQHKQSSIISHRLAGGSSTAGKKKKYASQSTFATTKKHPFVPIHPLPPYHDASPIVCTYDLTVYDCLAGLEKARQFGFFDFDNIIMTPSKDSITSTTTTTTSSSSYDACIDTHKVEDDIMIASMKKKENAQQDVLSPSSQPVSVSLFDINEYEYYEQVENGDLNWIIANKICAFAGPITKKKKKNNNSSDSEGMMYYNLSPAEYIPYFHKRNVQLVIRLNNATCYDEHEFTSAGIQHVTHYYMDGSCPTMDILHSVVADMERVIHRGEMMELEEDAEENEEITGGVENNKMQPMDEETTGTKGGWCRKGNEVERHDRGGGGAVAIHCKAGLGRTGTCIGAYIMKHYKFTAAEVIGYMRICRPGMVIGPQQHFLASIESLMWQEGDMYRMHIERLRGISIAGIAKEIGTDSTRLRKMSIDSFDGDEEMGLRSRPRQKQQQEKQDEAVMTPQANINANSSTVLSRGVNGGANVSIVTPDGQPFRLLTTPVNARQLHIANSIVNINSSPVSLNINETTKLNNYMTDIASPTMLQPRPVPITTEMDACEVIHPRGSNSHQFIDVDMANTILQEGDQANELLSRRMNRRRQST